MHTERSGQIIPYAKHMGITSFASMTAVKKALGIKKEGHTGTLDSFADGLLVLLSDKMTRFADIISAGKKSYEVWAEFGKQTASLDTESPVIKTGALPSIAALQNAFPRFTGVIEQTPPEFSAIKINGKRASDRMRLGETVILKPRPITIFNISTVTVITESNGNIKYAHLKVLCSKGTYIRSLVRDIAESIGTCGYVRALRRTRVGTFSLESAVGFESLPDFSALPKTWELKKEPDAYKYGGSGFPQSLLDEIKIKSIQFTPNVAEQLEIKKIFILEQYLKDFYCGKKIKPDWFVPFPKEYMQLVPSEQIAVFSCNTCIGLLSTNMHGFKYKAVMKNT